MGTPDAKCRVEIPSLDSEVFLSLDSTPGQNRVLTVSCFNVSHIFVDIFMIMHRTVMKFGMNIEAKHINDLWKFQLILFAK